MAAAVFDDKTVDGVFAGKVWNYIKDHVNGKVFCRIVNGCLQISIKQGKSVWRYDVPDIIDGIVMNTTNSQKCADYVLREYKKYIIDRANKYYFK